MSDISDNSESFGIEINFQKRIPASMLQDVATMFGKAGDWFHAAAFELQRANEAESLDDHKEHIWGAVKAVGESFASYAPPPRSAGTLDELAHLIAHFFIEQGMQYGFRKTGGQGNLSDLSDESQVEVNLIALGPDGVTKRKLS